MALPNFIILGPMKSGTSTLHYSLQTNENISMSRFKEPNYFNNNFNKPISWYKSLFDPEAIMRGDASPAYLKRHVYPKTAENMYSILPNAKLIFIARDPIDRLKSHLHHDMYRDRISSENLTSKIFENEDYIKTSSYYYQLEPFIEYFGKEKILILSFEELIKNTYDTIQIIFNFLEFSGDTDISVRAANKSSKRYQIKYYDFVHNNFPTSVTKLYHWIFYFLNFNCPRPILEESLLIEIKKQLLPDISAFKEVFGDNFNDWNTFNRIEIN